MVSPFAATEPREHEEDGLALALKRAQYSLHRALEGEMRRHGITLPQYTLLRALRVSGPLWGAELARRCFVSPQSLNGVLERLERAGLVNRDARVWPGRAMRVTLTERGLALVDECMPLFDAIEEQMVTGFTPAEREVLSQLLRRCTAHLTADPAERGR